MARLLNAGTVAAVRQICASIVLTLIVAFATSSGDSVLLFDESEIFSASVTTFLAWAYLIVAVGCALSIDKSTQTTADCFRHVSNRLRSSRPDRILVAVLAQSIICAIVLAILVLRGPPELLNRAKDFAGGTWLISITWAPMLSVGVAFFGAMAFAASRAIAK